MRKMSLENFSETNDIIGIKEKNINKLCYGSQYGSE